MREQLIQYVDLLFAGAADCEDIKQEILQNTLDRYDDLISEGKVPQAAYQMAITGIGDLTEILGASSPIAAPAAAPVSHPEEPDTPRKKRMRAIAIGLYILCPIPLFLTESVLGLCGLLLIVAVATVLIILGSRKDDEEEREERRKEEDPLRKSIETVVWAIGLALYFIVSFTTGAWAVTWIILLITGAVEGLIKAILDLKEACSHEN